MPPQAVDGLALLVHHVVVFQQVFAALEVLRFDGFLRGFDSVGDHLRLDGHALFHAQLFQQRGDPLLGEDAHEVVFQRQEESRSARVALAAGAAAQLVIDAPRLVPLRAQNEQPARPDHLFMFAADIRGVDLIHLGPVAFGDFELLALVIEAQESRGRNGVDFALAYPQRAGLALLHQFLPGHEVGIAAQQNVCAAPGHVSGDGHHTQAARLSHDFRFPFMELRVEHHVTHAIALQDCAEPLRLFDGRGAHQHRLTTSHAARRCSSATALNFSFSVR